MKDALCSTNAGLFDAGGYSCLNLSLTLILPQAIVPVLPFWSTIPADCHGPATVQLRNVLVNFVITVERSFLLSIYFRVPVFMGPGVLDRQSQNLVPCIVNAVYDGVETARLI